MFTRKLFLLAAALLVIMTGCQSGPSAQDQAGTMVALTAAAAPATNTAVPQPSDTPVPPTVAVTPTTAPTATPSGPLVITDDFTTKSAIWGTCGQCEWKDRKLYFGPYTPNGEKAIDQLHLLVCEACGKHTYYRVSADMTFVAGQAGDRFYGFAAIIPGRFISTAGITPYQFGVVEVADLQTGKYTSTPLKQYGAIKPGDAVNHLELDARLNASGTVDYYEMVNGKTIAFLTSPSAETTTVALYLGWHSVGITVDNFEFDQVIP